LNILIIRTLSFSVVPHLTLALVKPLLGFVFGGFLLSLLSSHVFADGKKDAAFTVVTSIRPLALIVEGVAGDLVDTEVLVAGNSSPHDYSLKLSQGDMIDQADLIVWVGPQFEGFLAGVVATRLERGRMVVAMQEADNHQHHDAHGHDHESLHLWLDPDQVKVLSARIAEALIELSAADREMIMQRLEIFMRSVDASVVAAANSLAPYRSAGFVAFHDGYSEFVDAFELQQLASLTQVPHEQISVRRLNSLAPELRQSRCMIVEQAEYALAARYARMFNTKLVAIDLLASDPDIASYGDYLTALSEEFVDCLK